MNVQGSCSSRIEINIRYSEILLEGMRHSKGSVLAEIGGMSPLGTLWIGGCVGPTASLEVVDPKVQFKLLEIGN
jgi:hypothetical protein